MQKTSPTLAGMKTIDQIREENLRWMLDRFVAEGHSQAEFADMIGISASYLSQLVTPGRAKVRPIGNRTARKIESALDLDEGWLDQARATLPEDQAAVGRAWGELSEESRAKIVRQITILRAAEQRSQSDD